MATPSFLQSYLKQLRIKWIFIIRYGDVEEPQIVSDKVNRQHEIIMPYTHQAFEEAWACDFISMVIRAHLAEKYDPIFAVTAFDPDGDYSDPSAAIKMRQVYFSQQIVEVWSYDIMAGLDRNLIEADVASLLDMAELTSDQIWGDMGYAGVIACALNAAHIKRYKLTSYDQRQNALNKRVIRMLGEPNTLNLLIGQYFTVMKLPQEIMAATKLYSRVTANCARILGFQVRPELVYKEAKDLWCWTF